MITLPNYIDKCISSLEQNGYAAYVVGGCVRDSLLGQTPSDWDICTGAVPDEVISCLDGWRVIPTGIAHGTVTALFGDKKVEITTFRTDGKYLDHRRPEQVKFTRTIADDLVRRDFTINAMAWNPREGLIDLCGGEADLRCRTLRCVGDAMTRFSEDALRILRLFRFAARLEFTPDAGALDAARLHREDLRHISVERIGSELDRLLVCHAPGKVLSSMCETGVMQVIMPEFYDVIGFKQHTPYHDRTVDAHTFDAVDATEPEHILRMTMLLHDIAKPPCFKLDKNGVGHFKGHPEFGAEMAAKILTRMHYPTAVIEQVALLIKLHDRSLPTGETGMKKMLSKLGEATLRYLIAVQVADCAAKRQSMVKSRLERLAAAQTMLEGIVSQNPCLTLGALAVNGNDLIAMGYHGREIGRVLESLLDAVIENRLPNEKNALLDSIKPAN